MNDQELEQKIHEKGADVAPRISIDDIENNIVSEAYFTASNGIDGALGKMDLHCTNITKLPDELRRLMFCVIVMKNGFIVTGESSCASPENFNAEIGRDVARKNAISKIWPLMGYELKSKLAQQ